MNLRSSTTAGLLLGLVYAGPVLMGSVRAASVEADQQEHRIGRPVDLCVTDSVVWVACERGASVLAIAAGDGRILATASLGGRPAAVVPSGSGAVAVVDRAGHRLVLCQRDEEGIRVGRTIRCIRDPIAADFAEGDFFVAGCWSRQLQRIEAEGRSVWTAELDFSPGVVRLLRAEGVVIAADEFSSRFAVVDAADGRVLKTLDYFGHRVRGICEDPDGERLVVSHQMLNFAAQSTRSDIHWGMTMANDLRWLRRESVLHGEGKEFYAGARVRPIGAVGNGGADPNDVAITPDGLVMVALGGVNEVAVGRESEFALTRLPVGRNPVAVACDAEGISGWVACRLDDSIQQIDLASRSVVRRIPLSEAEPVGLVELGERLFHDAALSHDGWMSCASCHPGGHAVNERADNLSDGDYGAPKRVLSLLGKSDTAPFGWTGSAETLEEQIDKSIHQTMRGRAADDAAVPALAAYLRTLEAPPSYVSLREDVASGMVGRGQQLFARLGCADCHAGDALTSDGLYDVGLVDENGRTEFNPPSLRGLAQRGPRYLHDLRAESLREVLTTHEHPRPSDLTADELDALVAFLESL